MGLFGNSIPKSTDWNKYSVFNENSWKEAGVESTTVKSKQAIENGHSVISILPNMRFYRLARSSDPTFDEGITGVMLSPVSYNIDSEWQSMGIPKVPILGGVLGAIEGFAGDASVLAGSGELGAVYKSKKLWRKSGYLNISPEFRIVDWDGNGAPLKQALRIARYALPGMVDSELNKTAIKITQYLNGLADTVVDSIGSMTNDVLDATHVGKENVMEDLHDFLTLKDAPPSVSLQLGQYFYHDDMVIDSVNFSFSNEVSEMGPLYVDVKLSMSSRKIMNGLNDVGIGEIGKLSMSRVEVDYGTASVSSPKAASSSSVSTNSDIVTASIATANGERIINLGSKSKQWKDASSIPKGR